MKENHKFIDLFAGIGGFHVAFKNTGRSECVFASEWDNYSRLTYRHNFDKGSDKKLFANDDQYFAGDITKVNIESGIPNFDILCGGFPCQPFSQAGRKLGFADTRGTLFFNIEEIIRLKQPKAFFLENVRGLISHGGPSSTKNVGKTLEVILHRLFGDKSSGGLGYYPPLGTSGYFSTKASDYGIPQHRPRVFIIGFKERECARDFVVPEKVVLDEGLLGEILGGDTFYHSDGKKLRSIGFTLRCGGKGSSINDRRNWEHYFVRDRESNAIKVAKINEETGLRLQGFPIDFTFPKAVGKIYRMKQLGNSVAVGAIQAWAESIIDAIDGVAPHFKDLPLFQKIGDF